MTTEKPKRKYGHCKNRNCGKTLDTTKGNRDFCSACEKTREPSPIETVRDAMDALTKSEDKGKSPIRGLNMWHSIPRPEQPESQNEPQHGNDKEEKKEEG